MLDYAAKFAAGLSYADFLKTHATEDQLKKWNDWHGRVTLSEPQRELLAGFKRKMPIVCYAGAWCGDCIQQCPIFDHFAALSPILDVRYFDRDAHPDLGAELKLCGGARVPVLVFLSEDYQPVGYYGDRTVAKYRSLAESQLGASCPTGLGGQNEQLLGAVTTEWLDQFERCQWMLRLSPRLRQLHGD